MTSKFFIFLAGTVIFAPLTLTLRTLPPAETSKITRESIEEVDDLTRFRLYPHLDRTYRALEGKDYNEASLAISRAEKIAPGYVVLAWLKADIAAEINKDTVIHAPRAAYIRIAEPQTVEHMGFARAPDSVPMQHPTLSMRGYTALANGDDPKAAALLAAAFFEETALSDMQRRQIARDLGYLHFKLGEQKMAARWWQMALDRQYDAETALLAATALIAAKEERAAKYQLDAIDVSRLSRQARIRYHEIAARLSPDAKMKHLAEIAEIEPTADRYYNLGFLQTGAGDLAAARLSFARARFLDPANAEILGALAYTELSLGNLESTILLFEELAREKPGDATLHAQLGYLYKQTGDQRFARYHFEQAIDYAATAATKEEFLATADPLRREIAALERGYSVSSYLFFRDNGFVQSNLTAAAQAIGGSQGSFQAAVRPGHYIRALDHIPAEIYGRLIWAFEDDSYRLRRDSLQAGLGVRLKPIQSLNLVLAAERLVSLGTNARDDWLLRASYSYGAGGGLPADKKRWFYYNLYLDGALIDPDDPDLFGAFEGQAGWAFRLGDKWTAVPHLLASGLIQKDDVATLSLLEAGPGVSLRYYFGGGDYGASAAAAEFRLQYRGKLAGSSDSKSGLALTAAISY